MKIWMLLSLLFYLNSFSQEIEHIELVKIPTEGDYFPNYAGYYQGEIPIEFLADSIGISNKLHWKVITFQLEYAYGSSFLSESIVGAKIPAETVLKIRKGSLGEAIFFTKIKAMDEEGRIHFLIPFQLTPTL